MPVHIMLLYYCNYTYDFYRAMRCKRGLCCHPVSVRLSVTFVDHVKTNKDIFEIFLPSGSDTIKHGWMDGF